MADKKVVKRTFEVEVRHIGPNDEWHSKEEIAEAERQSLASWKGLADEQRQALAVITRDSLLRLLEDPNGWIPTSMVPKTGNRFDIYISINLAEVDDEVIRRRVETERLMLETRDDLVTLHGETRDSDGNVVAPPVAQ